MLSVHRERVKKDKDKFVEEVLNAFAAEPRRLIF